MELPVALVGDDDIPVGRPDRGPAQEQELRDDAGHEAAEDGAHLFPLIPRAPVGPFGC